MANEQGREGEELCAVFLSGKGYRVLKRNYHSAWGEIDLIAEYGEFIVFVEVKTRTGSLDKALSSVSQAKIRRLVKTASAFLGANPEFSNRFTRFDVVALSFDPKSGSYLIRHLEDAFRPPSVE